MHTRRLVCLLLGVWLGSAVFMFFVATQNFRSVDRLLAKQTPNEFAASVKTLGTQNARALLRYHSSELNRFYFDTWEKAQLGLGVLLFGMLLFATRVGRIPLTVALLMTGIVALMHWVLTPRIVEFGKMLDFVPADSYSPYRRRFWILHGAYSALEVLKLLLGLALSGWFLWARRRRGGAGHEVNPVDYANDSHVDG
jgi:hypothetical protein